MQATNVLNEMDFFHSFEAAGMQRPSDDALALKPKRYAPNVKSFLVNGARVIKRKAKSGQMIYRPGIHPGPNGLEDFDGSWIETNAVYE